MKDFSTLIESLESSNTSQDKIKALVDYFNKASNEDILWAIALFTHRRPRRLVRIADLRVWALEFAGISAWLFEDCLNVVGDVAETIASVLPERDAGKSANLSRLISTLILIENSTHEEKKQYVLESWSDMRAFERFIFNKLLTGGFRMGVSQRILCKALALYTNKAESDIAHRLMGDWNPNTISFENLFLSENATDDDSRPFSFCLANPLDIELSSLGSTEQWQIEWKWDGIRAQILKRNDQIFIWSRGEELLTDKFPELVKSIAAIEGSFALDGEIVCMKENDLLPFSLLYNRLCRKNITKKALAESPAVFIAFDLLELEFQDLRSSVLESRRHQLELLLEDKLENIYLSEIIHVTDWNDCKALHDAARAHKVDGLMLKKLGSFYRNGREKSDWWKWKIEPLCIDAVLVYAQSDRASGANMFANFTFAVWNNNELIPFAKANAGLTDNELNEVQAFIKNNRLEKFGPVSVLKAELVFEIAFDGISESKRHKSGVAVRSPKILSWCKDKKASQANSLTDLRAMLKMYD